MEDILDKVMNSIDFDKKKAELQQMAFSGTTGRSKTNNNPLNLEYRPGSYQDKYGAELEPVSKSGQQRFAKFPTMESGYNAGLDQIRLDQQRGHTLASFVAKFAPPHENPTSELVSSYAKQLGVSPDTSLADIPPEKLIVPMLARESSTRIVSGKSKVNPDASMMVADVSGKATPQPQGNIEDIVGELLGKQSPKQEAISKAMPTPPGVGGTISATKKESPDLSMIGSLLAIESPQKKFEFLAKRLFPGMDPASAAKRFRIDHDGNILYIDENDVEQRVIPDTLMGKTKEFVANVTRPQNIGALVGGMWGIPGMAAGAAAGSLAEQLQGQALGDESKGIPGMAMTAGKEALIAGGSGLAGKSVTPFINKTLRGTSGTGKLGQIVSRESQYFDPVAIQGSIEAGKRYGIDLTAPEVVNSPTLKALWANIAKTPGEPAEKVARFIEQTRSPQVERAIQRELGKISSEDSLYRAGAMGKQTGQEIEGGLKESRRLATTQDYETAWQTAKPVDTSPVLEKIDDLSKEFAPGSPNAKTLNQVKSLFVDTEGQPITDLKTLHNSKESLDKLLAHPETQLSVTKRADRNISEIKDILKTKMGEASPEYLQAQEKFATESKPLNNLIYGDPNLMPKDKKAKTIIGRLIDMPDKDYHKAQSIVFDNTAPESVKKAREWFVNSGNEDSWNGLVRARLQSKLDMIADNITNSEGNFGYAFRRNVFKNETERLKLKAALSPDQFNNFSDFMDVLNRTSRIVYTNSSTAHQLAANEAIGENISGIRGALINVLQGYGRITGAVTNAQYTANLLKKEWTPLQADKFLQAMLDPSIAPKLARIKQLGPKTQALTEFGTLLTGMMGMESYEKPTDIPYGQ